MSKKRKKKARSRKKSPIVENNKAESLKDQVPRQASKKVETNLALGSNIKAYLEKVKSFLKEVRVEFDKVTWPSKKEIIAMTSAVLAITFFFTAYLGLVDVSLTKLVSLFIY